MVRSPLAEDRRSDGDYSSPASRQVPEEAGIKEIFGSLRRRRGLILAIGILGATAATLAGLSLTPEYTAKALILVDPSSQQHSEQGTIETQNSIDRVAGPAAANRTST